MTLKELALPAMGEGITDASIIRWLVKEGERIAVDQPLVEIATDKVDSEVPSPFDGFLKKIIAPVGSIPKIGETIAVIQITEHFSSDENDNADEKEILAIVTSEAKAQKPTIAPLRKIIDSSNLTNSSLPFCPPYIRMLTEKLNINLFDLATYTDKGKGDIFSKSDVEKFIAERVEMQYDETVEPVIAQEKQNIITQHHSKQVVNEPVQQQNIAGNYKTVELSRIRKKIAENMLASSKSIPHVTSFIEADATNMVIWREKVKDIFLKKYNTKLTFTPLFIEAIVSALVQYPEVNVSLSGENVIIKEDINIGMATVLPDKNLIVPVVMRANTLNLQGLAQQVNDLSEKARTYNLKPHEIAGSSFTFTNIGVFGTLTGTPLINMPEAAILSIGAINKKPSVITTSDGYAIGIRDIVMLSLAYDHRVIDGGLGGLFLKAISNYIENFDINREI